MAASIPKAKRIVTGQYNPPNLNPMTDSQQMDQALYQAGIVPIGPWFIPGVSPGRILIIKGRGYVAPSTFSDDQFERTFGFNPKDQKIDFSAPNQTGFGPEAKYTAPSEARSLAEKVSSMPKTETGREATSDLIAHQSQEQSTTFESLKKLLMTILGES